MASRRPGTSTTCTLSRSQKHIRTRTHITRRAFGGMRTRGEADQHQAAVDLLDLHPGLLMTHSLFITIMQARCLVPTINPTIDSANKSRKERRKGRPVTES